MTMLPVSDAEMAQIRADVAGILNLPCIIQHRTVTLDGMGQESESFSNIEQCMAGMTQPSAGLLANYGFRVGPLATWHVHLPYGIVVAMLDQLIIAGQRLTVQVLLNPQSYAVFTNVLASEVK